MPDEFNLLLIIIAFGCAVVHIRAEYVGHRQAVYVFKPLTTSTLILLAFTAGQPVSLFYQCAIGAGLILSLVGDVCLMLPKEKFIGGLTSFLLAHSLYIAAFTSQSGLQVSPWASLPFLAYGAIILNMLWSHLGPERWPVAVYVLVITGMGWRAFVQADHVPSYRTWAAVLGAILFVISDSLLAFNRYRRPFRPYRALNLSTYYAAQCLIAMSVDARYA